MPYEDRFSALSHPLRQQILMHLRAQDQSVRDLTDALNVSQPVMSQHLKVLRQAGLVTARPVGVKRLYRVDPAGLDDLRAFLQDHWTAALQDLDKDSLP